MNRRRILLVVAVVVAALGLALVFVYAQGADNRAKNKVTTAQVLVATQEIPAGENAQKAAQEGKVVIASVPTSALITGATSDATQFVGKYALVNLYPGEQLLPAKFGTLAQVQVPIMLPLPAGTVATTVSFSNIAKLGSFTPAGSPVALLISGAFGPDSTNQTCVLLPKVDIIAVGNSVLGVTPPAGTAPVGTLDDTDYTLALSPDDALYLNSVQTEGTLSLLLLSQGEKLKAGQSVSANGEKAQSCTGLATGSGS